MIKNDLRLSRYQEVRGEDGEEREGKEELDSQSLHSAHIDSVFSDPVGVTF